MKIKSAALLLVILLSHLPVTGQTDASQVFADEPLVIEPLTGIGHPF